MASNDFSMQLYTETPGACICFSTIKNMTYLEHTHLEYELLFVLEGDIDVTILNHKIKAVPNDLLFISNNVPHSYATQNYSVSLVLACSPSEVPRFTQLAQACGATSCCLKSNGSLYPIIHSLTDTQVSSQNLYTVTGYINMLLSHVSDALSHQPHQAPRQITPYNLILDYISDHLSDATEDSIAKEIGMSKYALSRLFNQNMGCNLRTYISSIRINTARRMLIQTDLPINEIALRCGYSSSRSFNRDFLRFCGMQPREYRNLERPGKMVNYQNPLANEIFLKKWASPAFTDYPSENIFHLSPASQSRASRRLQA